MKTSSIYHQQKPSWNWSYVAPFRLRDFVDGGTTERNQSTSHGLAHDTQVLLEGEARIEAESGNMGIYRFYRERWTKTPFLIGKWTVNDHVMKYYPLVMSK